MPDNTRPHLGELLDLEFLEKEIEGGWIKRNPHPTLPLDIYTYTRACQYDQHWNGATIACRGLVVDRETYEIAAFCFPKFFNYEQAGKYEYAPTLPNEQFEIFEKVDGSLGIVFNYRGQWIAASKGSFISEQAAWAQNWLERDCCGQHPVTAALNPDNTYLAEIVYPANRIVVDYGNTAEMVLLGVYGPDGKEIELTNEHIDAWKATGGSVVGSFGMYDHAETLAMMANGNTTCTGSHVRGFEQEGYVLRFKSGVRTKVKFAEYVHLHRLMTGINANDVWRTLGVQLNPEEDPKRLARALLCSEDEINSIRSSGGSDPIETMLEAVPDEFDHWVRTTCDGILDKMRNLRDEMLSAHVEAVRAVGENDRRAYAQYARKFPPLIRSGMFLILDSKNLAMLLWQSVKPAAATPFREDEEG